MVKRQRRVNRSLGRSRRQSEDSQNRCEPGPIEFDRWLFTGAIALGLGAAMASGCGLAHADTSDTGGTASSSDHSQGIGSVRSAAAAAKIATGAPAPTSIGRTRRAVDATNSAAGSVASFTRAVTVRTNSAAAARPKATTQQAATSVSTGSQSNAEVAVATPSTNAKANAATHFGALVNHPALPDLKSAVSGPLAFIERNLDPTLLTIPAARPGRPVDGLIDRLIGGRGIGTRNPAADDTHQAAVSATVVSVDTPSTTNPAIVPLRVNGSTEPLVDISVNGGPTEPVLVDTGSNGLVVRLRDVGLLNLGWPTGFGVSSYSGGLTYLYATYTTTVNFGNGIVTAPTSVDVALLSFPGSFDSFVAADGATGILGVGPNAPGPGPSSVIAALPGNLSDGVLIDEPHGVLEFGPNPLPARVSVSGAPHADLGVQIGGGPLKSVPAIIDSGGVYGTIPSSLTDYLPAGTVVSVYADDGQTLLYSYTTDGVNTPTVTSDDYLNTGYEPFAQQPVYISYSPPGVGTTTFDYL